MVPENRTSICRLCCDSATMNWSSYSLLVVQVFQLSPSRFVGIHRLNILEQVKKIFQFSKNTLFFNSPTQTRVPVILDRVVGSAFEELRDFGPLVSDFLSRFVDDPVFFDRPVGLVDFRIQVIVPALAALLPDPAWNWVIFCGQSRVIGKKWNFWGL